VQGRLILSQLPFREPLVSSAAGGTKGGGAHVSDAGLEVLKLFRVMKALAKVLRSGRIHRVQSCHF
jgi:molybdate transport system regulatory protein